MRPITRRLRLFAAVLALAQAAVPALAVAHELEAAGSASPQAHAESQGTTHDVVTHSHECGMCRTTTSKASLPGDSHSGVDASSTSRRSAWTTRLVAVGRDDGFVALPRGPPVG